MDAIRCYNYDSFALETKFGWMQTGAGANAATGFGRMLAQLSADFAAADGNIRAGLRRRGIDGWTGRASGAANAAIDASLTVLASHGEQATSGSGAANQYGDSFAATKNAIPAPPEHGLGHALASDTAVLTARTVAVPGPTAAISYGAGVAADYVQQLVEYQRADQLANDALREHEATTRRVLAAFHGAVVGEPSSGAAAPGVGGVEVGSPRTAAPTPASGSPTATDTHAIPGPVPGLAGIPVPGIGASAPGIDGVGPDGVGRDRVRSDGPSGGGSIGSAAGGPPGQQPAVPSWAPLPIGGSPGEVTRGPAAGPRTPGAQSRPAAVGSSPVMRPPTTADGERPTAGPYRGGNRPATPGSPAGAAASEARGGAVADRSRGGVVPLGPGAGGLADRQREHRDNYFLPDDSPFRADDDLIGVPPAVIGPEYLRELER